jgi:streptomycin 6-kinase
VGAVFDVPDLVRARAVAQGSAGAEWLAQLPSLVADVERSWRITAGRVLAGGSAALVLEASGAGGQPVVVKLAIPDGGEGGHEFTNETTALLLADGRGHVRVLEHDLSRRALLLERLGRPLARLGRPVEEQIDVTAEAVRLGWRPVAEPWPLPSGREKAEWLGRFVTDMWDRTGRPCARALVDRALEYADRRADAFDPGAAVLVHGDAHSGNLLEATAPGDPPFKLVDPEGLVSEPAHDLGVALREWTPDADDREAAIQTVAWCRRVADRSDADAQAVWEWAFVERVSSALLLLHLGQPALGRPFLQTAAAIVDVEP